MTTCWHVERSKVRPQARTDEFGTPARRIELGEVKDCAAMLWEGIVVPFDGHNHPRVVLVVAILPPFYVKEDHLLPRGDRVRGKGAGAMGHGARVVEVGPWIEDFRDARRGKEDREDQVALSGWEGGARKGSDAGDEVRQERLRGDVGG